MSATRDPDRILRAWLDLMPDEAPDRTIADVLQAVEVTPQVRWTLRWPSWRPTPMNRFVAALVAAVIVVAVGTVLIGRSGSGPSVGTSAAPAGSPSAPAGDQSSASSVPSRSAAVDSSNQPLPAAIVARWMGGNSSYVVSGSGSSIVLATDRLTITQSNQNDVALLNATASAPSPGTFRLVGFGGQGCPANGVGTYSWTLSPSGRVLSVQQVTEDCPNRGSAVAGTWYRMACRDPGTPCLGPLDAGTYPSQFLRPDLAATDTWAPKVGAMTYTVPQGWANYEDWPGWVGLTPIADFDRTTPNNLDPGVDIIVDAGVRAESQATPCSGTPDPKVGTTVAAILESIRHVRGLTVGPATSISIDGHAGVWADLTPDPSKIVPCGTDHVVEYLMAAGEGHGIGATERRRMFLLDLGSGHIVLIEIQALDPSRFAAFVPEAMPIVESFTFA